MALQPNEQTQVLVQETLSVRTLTLNRPRQLNALSLEMIARLSELLLAYENNVNVKLIIVKGNGRAFSAGGDLATIHGHFLKGNLRFGARVSQTLLTLTFLIATLSKPQVSFLNGIVMGGGAGISVHGKFRVATENSVFAMPETDLGFFPDVGASYFLSRLPGFFGEYLGLTGANLDGAEMLACGLATHYVPSAKLSLLEEALTCRVGSYTSSIFDLASTVSAIIDEYSLKKPALSEKSAYYKKGIIDKCFSKPTVEEILSALEEELTKANTRAGDHKEWLAAAIQPLKKASPMSSKITLRSIREGRVQGIGECLVREYRITCHILQGEINKDCREGWRATLWDKDKKPKWKPSKLELITDDMVEHYFSKLDGDDRDWKELKLPTISKLPVFANSKL